MNADLLRRAAALMRERAGAATPGPWTYGVERNETNEPDPNVPEFYWTAEVGNAEDPQVYWSALDDPTADAAHIASWHPAVALAVAKVLEARDGASTYDDWHALADAVDDLAHVYLGEQS